MENFTLLLLQSNRRINHYICYLRSEATTFFLLAQSLSDLYPYLYLHKTM